MELSMHLPGLEQTLGGLLILFVLLDVFLTVLYARAGTSVISVHLARLTWRCFRWGARAFGRRQATVLSLCGPAILVLLVLVWALALTCGAALIIHPVLGTSVQAANGPTPTSSTTALFVAGSSMSIVGASSFGPQTDAMRVVYLFNSLIGMSVISLTLTYLMQVYTALQQRNALGLAVHLLTAETGDAAELLARLVTGGQFDAGHSNLADVASAMTRAKEAHHFYPVLFFFRFDAPYYSVSRMALVALDTVTLLTSALDDKPYRWLKESATAAQLRRASLLLVTTLEDSFLPSDALDRHGIPDLPTRDRWCRQYCAALQRLRQAGIETVDDEQAGAERYVAQLADWDYLITRLAPTMAYGMDEIDPTGSRSSSRA